ncbi:hypothetical protein MHYP_G00279100 [Metynnis hypsauchen]
MLYDKIYADPIARQIRRSARSPSRRVLQTAVAFPTSIPIALRQDGKSLIAVTVYVRKTEERQETEE